MIADPNDLVRGRTDDAGGDAAAISKAVTAYRTRTLTGNGGTGLKVESSKGGQ
jgi:pilus assembly protein CpaD